MPAAAVIPAPLAYIKVVAVKKLVVGSQVVSRRSSLSAVTWRSPPSAVVRRLVVLFTECHEVHGTFTLNKLECSKQAIGLNSLAWNNGIGLRFYFVGFRTRSND